MNRTLTYLCLQVTRQGQASYAHVHEIANGLRKREWEVELHEPHYSAGSLPSVLTRLLAFISVQFNIYFAKKKAEILYVRLHFAAFPTVLWAHIKHIPQVLEVNGPYEDLFIAWPWTRKFERFFKWLMRKQIQFADEIIVVTPELGEWVKHEVKGKEIHVVPNGANTELFNPSSSGKFDISRPYVVFFGALAAWQGIEVLLQALSEPDWPKDVCLLIIGDGVCRDIVESSAQINSQIIYLGMRPYIEMPKFITNALAGVCPMTNLNGRSSTGLYPLKLFETLSCGIPVIVTDFPGQADLVRECQCGIVVPSESPRSLAKAVSYLYTNQSIAHQMGMNGRKAMLSEHSWDIRAGKTAQILEGLLNKKYNLGT
jgi:glycosyltransferase involved in cell wall biosynthesis